MDIVQEMCRDICISLFAIEGIFVFVCQLFEVRGPQCISCFEKRYIRLQVTSQSMLVISSPMCQSFLTS